MKKDQHTALLENLADVGRRTLAPGQEFTLKVASNDIDVEICVRVRRRAPFHEIASYRQSALEQLRANPALHARECSCDLQPRKSWMTTGGQCHGRIVAAVVFTWGVNNAVLYRFVCGRHRDKHLINPARVLATVELPAGELEELRKLGDKCYEKNLPPCAASMNCLCAGHARGDDAAAPCDTSEKPAHLRRSNG